MTRPRQLLIETSGAAYVEFLVVFPPVFLLMLVVAQQALVAHAQLIVQHAAWAGARAAIVVLDDDPAHYDDEPRGLLSPDTDADNPGWEAALATLLGLGDAPQKEQASRRGGARLATIRRAVSRPLAVLAPDLEVFMDRASGGESIGKAIGSGGPGRVAVGLALYNDLTAAVTFPQGPNSELLHSREVPAAEQAITLRVTYLLRCGIPMAAALLCTRLHETTEAGLPAVAAPAPGPALQQGLRELEHVPSPRAMTEMIEAGGYYRVLRAEVTLPRQSASYVYASEKE